VTPTGIYYYYDAGRRSPDMVLARSPPTVLTVILAGYKGGAAARTIACPRGRARPVVPVATPC